MTKMTQTQKDFINEVILPRLIEMAVDGDLDSDMNVLSYHDFEEATEKFNASESQEIARKIETLKQYFGEDELTYEEQLKIIETHPNENDFLSSIDGLAYCEVIDCYTIKDIRDLL